MKLGRMGSLCSLFGEGFGLWILYNLFVLGVSGKVRGALCIVEVFDCEFSGF